MNWKKSKTLVNLIGVDRYDRHHEKGGDVLFNLGQVCIFCKVTSDKERIYLATERLKDGDNVIYVPLSLCLDCYDDLCDYVRYSRIILME